MEWTDEWTQIRAVACTRNVDPCLIAAIRKAEGGGEGRQYGVLAVHADSYLEQLTVCCNTIRRYVTEYPLNPTPVTLTTAAGIKRVVYSRAFITYCASRYAPGGVENDPTNLNANWASNVWHFYTQFAGAGDAEADGSIPA